MCFVIIKSWIQNVPAKLFLVVNVNSISDTDSGKSRVLGSGWCAKCHSSIFSPKNSRTEVLWVVLLSRFVCTVCVFGHAYIRIGNILVQISFIRCTQNYHNCHILRFLWCNLCRIRASQWCSYNRRIWSHRKFDLLQWIQQTDLCWNNYDRVACDT